MMNDTAVAAVPLTRDQIRAELIGKKHKGKTKLVTLFGVEIELRQPTLATILDARDIESERDRTASVFINYAYVPGTDERVFEDTDKESILNWPFAEELIAVQEAIGELTGVDLKEIEAELKADPLEEPS